jgi:hypothetical protein
VVSQGLQLKKNLEFFKGPKSISFSDAPELVKVYVSFVNANGLLELLCCLQQPAA